MSNMEIAIIIELYNSPGYSNTLNYNDPIVKGLLARNFIYGGGQFVELGFDNSLPMKFALQPLIYQALDYYKPKLEKEICKLESKIHKEKNETKKTQLAKSLKNMKENYNGIYNNGGTR